MASKMSDIVYTPGLRAVLSSTGGTVLTLIVTCLIIPLATWCLSLVNSRPVASQSGKEPPVAPYALPYFQHMIAFLRNPDALVRGMSRRYGSKPFSLMMMNTKFHIFGSAATAQTVFGRSRDFVFEPVLESMFSNGMALPSEDMRWFHVPLEKKSSATKEDLGLNPREFVEHNHRIWVKYLSGKWLDAAMEVYLANFVQSFDKVLNLSRFQGNEWVSVNLHEGMQRIVFETSVMTFFGPRLGAVWGESMWEDFKAFNDATYVGMRFGPIYTLSSKAGSGREEMLKAFEKWVANGQTQHWDEADDETWSEEWGFRLNVDREQLSRKYGFTLRGRATLHAAFLFVIITNAAPMATWLLLSIVLSPARLSRFHKEISSYLLPADASLHPDDLRFDLAGLQANPFVHGVWNEAIRLGSQSAAARVVTQDTELEGYLLRKGSVVLLPVRLLHFDEAVFPDADSFIPERWIDQDEEQQKRQRASLRAFGGGKSLCSGRYIAEKEVLSFVSTLLLLFDFEIENTGAVRKTAGGSEPVVQLNPRSLGVMSPLGDTRARMRRRIHPHALAV